MIEGGGKSGTGWGIDIVLHNYGDCTPDYIYGIGIPLDHANIGTLGLKGTTDHTPSWLEVGVYREIAREKSWAKRAGMTTGFRGYHIHVTLRAGLKLGCIEK